MSGPRRRLRGATHLNFSKGDRTCRTVDAASDWRPGSRWFGAVTPASRFGRSLVRWRVRRTRSGPRGSVGRPAIRRAGGFSCLWPRRPIPRSCPHALSAAEEDAILGAGTDELGADAPGGRDRAPSRDDWKVLKRHGVSRRRRAEGQTFRRFEWSQPGALLHIDAYSAPKFQPPGIGSPVIATRTAAPVSSARPS